MTTIRTQLNWSATEYSSRILLKDFFNNISKKRLLDSERDRAPASFPTRCIALLTQRGPRPCCRHRFHRLPSGLFASAARLLCFARNDKVAVNTIGGLGNGAAPCARKCPPQNMLSFSETDPA